MSNIDTFRNFCKSVSKGETPAETRCTATSPREVLDLLDKASTATKWFAGINIQSKASGQGNIQQNGFSFRAGVHSFTVLPPGKAPAIKKGVAASSIEKYHSIDTRGQAHSVAMAAIALTKQHGFTTDSQVAEFVGIPAGRVSARRSEIEKIQGVVVMETPYYFQPAGRVTCPITRSSVNGWRMVAAGQTEMFQ